MKKTVSPSLHPAARRIVGRGQDSEMNLQPEEVDAKMAVSTGAVGTE